MIVPPIGGLGGGLASVQAEGLTQAGQAGGLSEAASAGSEAASGGFGSALTEAVSSLEKTQQSGDSAAQALATGKVADPQAAVVTVEDAQLAMQLAAQIRTKATEAVQTIFQTQV
jgi:flagellar hook-basal body complex protein FliE